MVSWSGDGLVSGYDPTTKKHKTGLFHLASPGTVDVNGGTRLHRGLVSTYPNRANYPTRLRITAPLTFVSGDFSANPGKDMGVAAVLVKASSFAAGVVPTPAQIFAMNPIIRDEGSSHRTTPGSITPVMEFLHSELEPNTKYWLLVYPAAINNPANPWNRTNYKPLGSINTNGRAISIWTNRQPAAPTITSPPTGSIIESGDTFTLAYTPNDPDKLTPNDTLRSNHDLAGVEIEYAAQPTSDNPIPNWKPLGYWDTDTVLGEANVAVGEPGGGATRKIAILRNLSIPVLCGVGASSAVPSHGSLPAGDWMIRIRVADFGHAWPNIVNPLGVTPARPMSGFPATSLSPWSEPVRVFVPSQVPPPIPLSPKDQVATQEGSTVRMTWQYRNTSNPPFDQAERWVQIRAIGDPEWSTVFAGVSGNPYVDLPPTIDNPAPSPDEEYLDDVGFEANTTDGWLGKTYTDYLAQDYSAVDSTGVTLTNVNSTALSRSGDRHLRLDNTGAEDAWPVFVRTVVIDPLHTAFSASAWFLPPPEAEDLYAADPMPATMIFGFLDSSDELILPVGVETTFVNMTVLRPDGGWGWIHFDAQDLQVPSGAVKAVFIAYAEGLDAVGAPALLTGHRLDDVTIVGSDTFGTDDFTLEATTRYEWRVRVRDTSGVISVYSPSAHFWVVPAPGSGEVISLPEETIDGATLGCGTHRVFVYRRGGLERVGEIRGITYLDWGRLRDDISDAKIVVEDWDVDCGELLARLQTIAYEVVIYRDNGYSSERVWEGPITLLTYEHDKVTILAKDVMVYPYRRIIKQAMSDAGTGNGRPVTLRAAQVIQNVMAPDDPNVLAYLQVIRHDDDAMQYRSTPAYSRTAFEEVDDMAANSGLDYTAVGRAIILWSTRHRIGTLPEFRDENLGSPPIVSEYGMSLSNNYSVSDGNGVHGEADRLNEDGEDPIYGLVEMLSSTWASDSTEDSGTYTQEGLETVRESFREFAERSIADRYPPPVVVRVPDNTTLNPDTVLSIQQLVPGVVIPLRSVSTLRTVSGNQKLDAVRVVEEGGRETISITMSPFNRDDSAIEGEGEE